MLLFRRCTVMYILFVFLHVAHSDHRVYDQFGNRYCTCHEDKCGPYWQSPAEANTWCRDSQGWPRYACAEHAGIGQGWVGGNRYGLGGGSTEDIECRYCLAQDGVCSERIVLQDGGFFAIPINNQWTLFRYVWPNYGQYKMQFFCVPCYQAPIVEAPPPPPPYVSVDSRVQECLAGTDYCGTTTGKTTPCVCCGAQYYHMLGAVTQLCVPCELGKYLSWNYIRHQVTSCPLCHAGSTAYESCNCYAGYTGLQCAACAAGTYKPISGTASCTSCAAGKYSAVTGSAECTACAVNSNSAEGSSACQCNSGFYGSQQCTCCASGTYKTILGSEACTKCLAGKYSTAQGATSIDTCQPCPPNSYSSEGWFACECNAGYHGSTYQIEDNTTYGCTACAAGTYKTSDGLQTSASTSQCTLCSAGKYSASTGQTSATTCTACLPNSNSPEGSSDSFACECNRGYTREAGRQSSPVSCMACAAGTYKTDAGNYACTYYGLCNW
jgi:hypothetical protein